MMQKQKIHIVSTTKLPTEYGEFTLCSFSDFSDGKEHIALVRGDVAEKSNVPIRIHSECLTGDALGSLRCDCRSQLLRSLDILGKEDCGAILYLRQEGRGIGLLNKIKAYALQDQGLDTLDANLALGFKADERTYDVAIDMLRALRITSVILQTNNPEKIKALHQAGLLASRASHQTESNSSNQKYLQTKKDRFKHLLT